MTSLRINLYHMTKVFLHERVYEESYTKKKNPNVLETGVKVFMHFKQKNQHFFNKIRSYV